LGTKSDTGETQVESRENRSRGSLIPCLDPFLVTRAFLNQVFSSPRLVQRLIAAGWIITVRPGRPGCEALFDYPSAKAAYGRLKAGEQPPLLPSELRYRSRFATKH